MIVLVVGWLHIQMLSQVCQKNPSVTCQEPVRESEHCEFFISGLVEEEDIYFMWESVIYVYIFILLGQPLS